MTASSASASAPSPVPLAIARSMLSLGIEASRAFWTASGGAGLPSTPPPPSFAATVMARASLVKSLPRRASTIAFLCLIPAHLLCPAMQHILSSPAIAPPARAPGAAPTRPQRVEVVGVEREPEYAREAATRLDRVVTADLERLDPGDL